MYGVCALDQFVGECSASKNACWEPPSSGRCRALGPGHSSSFPKTQKTARLSGVLDCSADGSRSSRRAHSVVRGLLLLEWHLLTQECNNTYLFGVCDMSWLVACRRLSLPFEAPAPLIGLRLRAKLSPD